MSDQETCRELGLPIDELSSLANAREAMLDDIGKHSMLVCKIREASLSLGKRLTEETFISIAEIIYGLKVDHEKITELVLQAKFLPDVFFQAANDMGVDQFYEKRSLNEKRVESAVFLSLMEKGEDPDSIQEAVQQLAPFIEANGKPSDKIDEIESLVCDYSNRTLDPY